jgi:hypothetical protein
VLECPKEHNYFPAHHGVSKYCSPEMNLHQQNMNLTNTAKYALGEYVQANDELTHSNTKESHSFDCIDLRPISSTQGGHELWHLSPKCVYSSTHQIKSNYTSWH